jgi:hypothetical protein
MQAAPLFEVEGYDQASPAGQMSDSMQAVASLVTWSLPSFPHPPCSVMDKMPTKKEADTIGEGCQGVRGPEGLADLLSTPLHSLLFTHVLNHSCCPLHPVPSGGSLFSGIRVYPDLLDHKTKGKLQDIQGDVVWAGSGEINRHIWGKFYLVPTGPADNYSERLACVGSAAGPLYACMHAPGRQREIWRGRRRAMKALVSGLSPRLHHLISHANIPGPAAHSWFHAALFPL